MSLRRTMIFTSIYIPNLQHDANTFLAIFHLRQSNINKTKEALKG